MITPKYKQLLQQKHSKKAWGGTGWKWIGHLVDLMIRRRWQKPTILDYGCGRSTFKETMEWLMPHIPVYEYDPGIPGKDSLPVAMFDIVYCTDVMEHVEEQFVDPTLHQIASMARWGAFFVIDCQPSQSTLPDGNNAHVTIKPAQWWIDRLFKMMSGFEQHTVSMNDRRVVVEMWR